MVSQHNSTGSCKNISLIEASVSVSFLRDRERCGGVLHASSQCKDEMESVAAFEAVFCCGFVVGPVGKIVSIWFVAT